MTRFGWKAQNKSLTIFAGEAYNVEMGVTNEVFPNEREDDPGCAKNATPESDSNFAVGGIAASDVAAFRGFMRFLAPPPPACGMPYLPYGDVDDRLVLDAGAQSKGSESFLGSGGSEANVVISNFENLTSPQQQDLLNFLRSL